MNKRLYSLLLAVLTLTGLMTGCKSNDDIVFDHERQQFETRADRILLEFIAPFGTTPTEEIYILGAFNGEEEAVHLPRSVDLCQRKVTCRWVLLLLSKSGQGTRPQR